jgi:ApaG protein
MAQEDNQPIRVDVETRYIESQSEPDANRYAFAYTITIRNTGIVPARLLNRHWIITDANGKVQEVRGEGVVGQRPYLRPGEQFQYTSGTMIETPVGSMQGSYEMLSESGERFDAQIPAFSLSMPRTLH